MFPSYPKTLRESISPSLATASDVEGAFCLYGLFWLTLVFLLVFPELNVGIKTSNGSMAAYLFMWGSFTSMMFLGTLKLNRGLQVFFFSLTILFWLLALGDMTSRVVIKRIAGFEGVFCGLSAIYVAIAEVLRKVYGRVVLPIGPIAIKAENESPEIRADIYLESEIDWAVLVDSG
jgi:hypothetical protein